MAASGSPRLHRMSRTLLVETRMCLAALQQNPPPPESLLAEHRVLRDALEQGDAARMTSVLEAHMADAVSRILDVTVVEPRSAAGGEPPALPA
ncbi:FCD domain-containing protein [Pseudonocardia pini]|uniref:FCD domain-containing protein n=1 Tax=Pseudonocardia pini TaxID=2758030 RepID=UPI0035E41F21